MQYIVVIERKDDATYFASIPDLHGCQFTASSHEAVMHGIELEAQRYVSELRAMGKLIPEKNCFAMDVRVRDPRLSRVQKFIDDLLTRDYGNETPQHDELFTSLRRLPDDIENIVIDCKDLIADLNNRAECDLHFGMLGGAVGRLKLDLASYVYNFVTTQPFFESFLTVESAFSDDLPGLETQADHLDSLCRIAPQMLEKTNLINSGAYSGKAVCYYFFWLFKAASMMLVHASAFDMIKIFDEDEYGDIMPECEA